MSSSNEAPECVKDGTPRKSMSLKRKSARDTPLPSATNESNSQNSSNADLIVVVPLVDKDSNIDSISPPSKKRRESSNDHGTEKSRTRWRAWERQCLIEAFKECTQDGVWLDYKMPDLELCEMILAKFPEDTDITKENIQTSIYNILNKEHRRQLNNDNPIDKWIETIDAVSPKENHVAKQLELIMTVAMQEPIDDTLPPSFLDESLPQPNYEAIYQYLSKAFSNKPLPELSPIDSLVVEDLMQSLVFQVDSLNDGELRKSLRQVYLHLVQEPGEEKEHDHEELRRSLMHSITVLNPLGLNAQSIVPVPPK